MQRARLQDNFYGFFVLVSCLFMSNGYAGEISNKRIALAVRDGKAVLSYYVKGAAIPAAELRVVGASMRTGVVQKTGNGPILEIECDQQIVLRIAPVDQNPYLILDFTSPPDRKNTVLLNFKSDVMVVPDTLSDHYLLFRENTGEDGGRLFPGFHMVAHLLGNGNAMLSCAWLDADRVASGRTEKKAGAPYDYCRVEFTGKNRLLLGAPAAKGIWHKVEEKLEDTDFKKIAWQPPFKAKWLVNYSILDLSTPDIFLDESFIIPPYNKKKTHFRLEPGYSLNKTDIWQGYDQVNGRFTYPAYIKDGNLFLRHLAFAKKRKKVDCTRSHLIYALDNDPKKTNETMMPLPALAKLLPEDKLKALQWRRIYKGRGICSGTAEIASIFQKESQKKLRGHIAKILKNMNIYQAHVAGRLKQYLNWYAETTSWLDEQSRNNPKLAPSTQAIKDILVKIQTTWQKKKPVIKTVEDFAETTEQVSALIDSSLDVEEQEEKCKKLCRELRRMGGTQHHTIGVFRQTIRAVRRVAVDRLMATVDPAEATLLTIFLEKSSSIIRIRHGEEGK